SEHRLRGRPRPQCSTAGIAALPPRELRDGEGLRLPSSGTMTRRDQGALVLQKETALMAHSTPAPENDSADEPPNPPPARRRRRAGAPAGAPTFTPPVVAEPESTAPRTVVAPQDATSTEPATTTAPARRRRRAGAPAGAPVVPAENEPPVDEPAVEAVVEDEIIEDAPDTPDDAGAEDVTDENPVVDDLRALASARGAAPEDPEDEDRASRREQVQMDFASLLFQAPTPQPRTTVADQDRSDDAGAEDSDGSEDEDSPQEERSPRSRRSRSRSRRSSQRDEGIAEDSRESSSAQGGDDGDDSDDGDGTGDDSSGESRPSGNGGSRRRRRRGGRGRRGRGRGEDDSTDGDDETNGEAAQDDPESGSGGNGADSGGDSASGSSSSRRRRRRRRSGGGNDDSGSPDDPPNTVVKVREARDEGKAVKGSTRLEAKRQRRREGRDAGRRRNVITEAEFLARRESVKRSMVVRERPGRTQIAVLEDDVLVEHYVA